MTAVDVGVTYSETSDATANNQDALDWRKLGRKVDAFVQNQFLADASEVDFRS